MVQIPVRTWWVFRWLGQISSCQILGTLKCQPVRQLLLDVSVCHSRPNRLRADESGSSWFPFKILQKLSFRTTNISRCIINWALVRAGCRALLCEQSGATEPRLTWGWLAWTNTSLLCFPFTRKSRKHHGKKKKFRFLKCVHINMFLILTQVPLQLPLKDQTSVTTRQHQPHRSHKPRPFSPKCLYPWDMVFVDILSIFSKRYRK